MPLVDDADAQIHLPFDKVLIEAVPDDKEKAYEDADRIVRGYLAGVLDAATLNSWDTPANTPPQIRAIAGRFVAAAIYRLRFGQASVQDPAYAQVKYNEAMAMLQGVIDGSVVLTDPDTGEPIEDISTDFGNTYFLPNDESDPPKFTMSGRY